MTNDQLGQLTLAIALLLVTATVLGQLFARLRQPKVIGEILAGVLFGPAILGRIAPNFAHDVFGMGAESTDYRTIGLGFIYLTMTHVGGMLRQDGCAVKCQSNPRPPAAGNHRRFHPHRPPN